MAHIVGTGEYIEFNGVNLSSHVRSSNFPRGRDQVEDTSMTYVAHSMLPGLFTHGLEVTFAQDYAAAQVDATLEPLYRNGTVVTVRWRPTQAAASATNPEYSFTGFISQYNRGNQVGELQTLQVAVAPSGGAAVTRTAP